MDNYIFYFSGFETVVIGNTEMRTKRFYNILESNLENKDYGVSYNEETKKIKLTWDGHCYDLERWQDLDNKDIKRLIMLSKIEAMVDSDMHGKNLPSTKLDIDAKKHYIKILKNKKGAVKTYFKNLGTDLAKSFDGCTDIIEFDEETFEFVFDVGIIGAFVAIPFAISSKSPAWFWLGASGLGLVEGARTCIFLILQIPSRIRRLIDYISINKVKKTKIKALKKEIKNDYIEMREEKVGDTVKYVPVENYSPEHEIENPIPKMIDELVDALDGVDKVDITDIKEEIKDLISDYRDMTLNTDASDKDIFINNPSIFKRINSLGVRIDEARRTDGKIEVFNVSRMADTDYILDKLNSLDPKGKHDGKSKKLK